MDSCFFSLARECHVSEAEGQKQTRVLVDKVLGHRPQLCHQAFGLNHLCGQVGGEHPLGRLLGHALPGVGQLDDGMPETRQRMPCKLALAVLPQDLLKLSAKLPVLPIAPSEPPHALSVNWCIAGTDWAQAGLDAKAFFLMAAKSGLRAAAAWV